MSDRGLIVSDRDLTPGEISVLNELHAQSDRERWLTPGDLTVTTGLERRHVVAALSHLRKHELVRAQRGRWTIACHGLELLGGS